MIKIELKKATPKRNEIDLATDFCNLASDGFADRLKKELKNAKCEEHPNATSTVRVVSTPNKKQPFSVEKINFCCDSFKDSINFEFKK